MTDSAIAGAAGVRPRFVRPPYSATAAAVDAADERAYAGRRPRGYLIALSDFDGEDWRSPGVRSIVARRDPARPHGAA